MLCMLSAQWLTCDMLGSKDSIWKLILSFYHISCRTDLWSSGLVANVTPTKPLHWSQTIIFKMVSWLGKYLSSLHLFNTVLNNFPLDSSCTVPVRTSCDRFFCSVQEFTFPAYFFNFFCYLPFCV